MKPKKFEQLKEAVAEFIADHEMKNHHYLRDDEIVSYFHQYKKKHVKRALLEVR